MTTARRVPLALATKTGYFFAFLAVFLVAVFFDPHDFLDPLHAIATILLSGAKCKKNARFTSTIFFAFFTLPPEAIAP